MTTPGTIVRKQKEQSIDPEEQYQRIPPREIAVDVINGLPLTQIPQKFHQSLLAPLSAMKYEALCAGKSELADQIHYIIQNLQITNLPKNLPPIGNSIKSRSLDIDPQDEEIINVFYRNELKRLDEIHSEEISRLKESQKLDYLACQHRLQSAPIRRPTSAMMGLQQRERSIDSNSADTEAQQKLRLRISLLQKLEQKHRDIRAERRIQAAQKKLQIEHKTQEEKLEIDYSKRRQSLISQMNKEIIASRRKQFRSTMPAGGFGQRKLLSDDDDNSTLPHVNNFSETQPIPVNHN